MTKIVSLSSASIFSVVLMLVSGHSQAQTYQAPTYQSQAYSNQAYASKVATTASQSQTYQAPTYSTQGYVQPPTRNVPPAKADNYNYVWAGPYAGLTIGEGLGTSTYRFPNGNDIGDYSVDGILGGGTIGYNMQNGPLVFGFEADISGSDGSGHKGCIVGNCETDNPVFGTLRPRIGFAMDRLMPYVTAGLAVGEIKSERYIAGISAPFVQNSAPQVGWTAGGGAEYMFEPQWSVKAEYLFIQYADTSFSGPNYTVPMSDNVLRLGINYKLN